MTIHRANPDNFIDFFTYGPMTLGKNLSMEEFVEMTKKYPDLLMERDKNGKTTIMSPVKRKSGNFEFWLTYYIGKWIEEKEQGEAFSPSTGIQLPSGAIKSPDFAWISEEKLKTEIEEEDGFLKIVPNFIAEIRSSTDRLAVLKKKMTDSWMANGVELGWLIDPYNEKVYIYRAGKETEIIEGFESKKLSGENVMPGMAVPLKKFSAKK